MHSRKTLVVVLAVALTSLHAQNPASPQPYSLDHPAMGTTFTLLIYAPTRQQAESLGTLAFDEVDRIEALLSNYQPLSELSRINASAAQAPVTTDAETFRFLTESELWSRRSNGAFDITVGPLMRLWGFFRPRQTAPTSTELARTHRSVGWQHVVLSPSGRTVFFNTPGVELDPGGIGKGFAVDSAVALLRNSGVTAALLSAGSSTLYAIGAPPGEPGWRIRVPNPLDPNPGSPPLTAAVLRDTSLSSARCGDKHVTLGGHDFCHIMDPRSGHPVEGMLSVSIVDPSATASDAISNVLFVDGPVAGAAFLRVQRPHAQAIIVAGHASAISACATVHWQSPVSNPRCVSAPKDVKSLGEHSR